MAGSSTALLDKQSPAHRADSARLVSGLAFAVVFGDPGPASAAGCIRQWPVAHPLTITTEPDPPAQRRAGASRRGLTGQPVFGVSLRPSAVFCPFPLRHISQGAPSPSPAVLDASTLLISNILPNSASRPTKGEAIPAASSPHSPFRTHPSAPGGGRPALARALPLTPDRATGFEVKQGGRQAIGVGANKDIPPSGSILQPRRPG